MPPRTRAAAASAANDNDNNNNTSSKKKKGMSMEEKVAKVEAWCRGHVCPYTLKELQTLVPRATGVLYQSIDECVELLVAEGRLQQARVGVHTLHWCFPRTAWQRAHGVMAGNTTTTTTTTGSNSNNARAQAATTAALLALPPAALQQYTQRLRSREADVDAAIAQRQAALRDDSDSDSDNKDTARADGGTSRCSSRTTTTTSKTTAAAALHALTQTRLQLRETVERLRVHDPALLQSLHTATACAEAASERWADNYARVEACVLRRVRLSSCELRAALQMPDELARELPVLLTAAAATQTATTAAWSYGVDGNEALSSTSLSHSEVARAPDDGAVARCGGYPLPTLVPASRLLADTQTNTTPTTMATRSDEMTTTAPDVCADAAAAAAAAAVVIVDVDESADAAAATTTTTMTTMPADNDTVKTMTTTTTTNNNKRRKRSRWR